MDRLELYFEMGNICPHMSKVVAILEYAPRAVVDEAVKKYRNNGWEMYTYSNRIEIMAKRG